MIQGKFLVHKGRIKERVEKVDVVKITDLANRPYGKLPEANDVVPISPGH